MAPLYILGQDDRTEVGHDFFGYAMHTVLSMAQLNSLCPDDCSEMHHVFCDQVTPLHHMMLRALSMAPLCSFSQGDQGKMQHDFSGHVMPLVPALGTCDEDGIANGTTAFLRSRKSK